MIRNWIDLIKEMDTINLIILVLTFLSVTLICWGLVVIYCCLASYCDSPGSSSLSSNASLKKFSQIYPSHPAITTHHQQPSHHLNIFQAPSSGPLSLPHHGFVQHMIPSSFHPHHSSHASWNMPMFGQQTNEHINDRGKVMVPISDIVYI